ncbi:MAG TPA: DUF418 domain-containing protein [Allosphingosinicella sp.]|uniref:DUF418 domain-containing protein n=1 Tax=Allosphingosinicella sp. TaxID=2823234 RepID=UPI002EDA1896
MTAATEPGPRIETLDIVRGVAVMGILAMNIVAFAMPFQAYMNPYAYGLETDADLASWAFNFILVDGKMRGLFSFLFGASMLIVIERAAASGQNPASVHYRRMLWLLVFGLLHFYFIWFGDILSGYAMVGMIAWFFRNKAPRSLIIWGVVLVFIQITLFALLAGAFHAASAAASAPGASAEAAQAWSQMKVDFAVPSSELLANKTALFSGGFAGIANHQFSQNSLDPFIALLIFGWETLAYMLFGMAALKTGFLTGAWENARYRRAALIGFGIGIPAYALLAWTLVRDDFTVPMIFSISMAATVPFRPLMVVATAALIILLTRRGGALVGRIAAAGRAAFTNYLGTSILMTALFYGWGAGLWGSLSRAELWLVVIPMWAVMLLWSKPWLDRNRYGPFEWLWRSLSRWEWQPMRRPLSV